MPRVAVMSSERKPMSPRAGASNVTMLRPGSPGRRSMHAAAARRERLRDRADVLLGNVDDTALERLARLAVDLAGDHLGPAHLELVALPAHRLDEHRELQLAAAGDLEDVGRLGVGQLDRDVAEHLALEPLTQVAGGDVLPALPDVGAVFTPNVIRSTGSSTVRRGSGRGSSGSASVSPISTSGKPATTKRSPARSSSASTRG